MSQPSRVDLEARIAALEAQRADAASPRRRLSRARLAVALLAVALAAPAAVLASHRFTDVQTSNTFHDQISILATAGITRGCNPPTQTMYCPADPVSREQMAAFIVRSAGRMDQTLFDFPTVVDESPFASLTVKTEGRAWIDADAAFYFYSPNTEIGAAYPCENAAHIMIDGIEDDRTYTFGRTNANPAPAAPEVINASTHYSIAVEQGNHTVQLIWRDGVGTCDMTIGRGSLTARIIPFDASTAGTPLVPLARPTGGGASGHSSAP